MSKHRYLPNNILFDEDESDMEDEVTRNGFRKRIPAPNPKPVPNPALNSDKPGAQHQKQDLQKRLEIEEKTLQSVSRIMTVLQDTEETGICAAKELALQGEQLQSTNKMLDEVGANLKNSKKHVSGIKSVIHEIKNYISTNSPPLLRRASPKPPCGSSSGNCSFYDSTDDLSQKNIKKESCKANSTSHPCGLDVQASGGPLTNSQQIDNILEENCDKMTQHLARIKGIGIELGNQLDQQNELIDTLQNKVVVTDIKIGKQNKQIKKILKK